MNVGKTIKHLRKEIGISQELFAEECGITQTSLSQIETGTSEPRKKTVDRICEALEINKATLYLMSIEESDVPENKKNAFNQFMPTIKELLVKLSKCDPNEIIQ